MIPSVRRVFGQYGVVFALLAMVIGFSISMPETFATVSNAKTIVSSQAITLILAIAVTLPLRAGDLDLSFPGVMGVAAALTAVLLRDGTSLALIIPLALLVGALVGLVNGVLVVIVGVDSLIATLGMFTALGGLTYAIMSSQVIAGLEGPVTDLARYHLLGLPMIVWIAWALVVVAWYLYERTPLGRLLLFVGGNRDAARLSGVSVVKLRMGALMVTGIISGFAGVLLAGYLGAMDPSVPSSYLLPPIAAAFLGATTVKVGRFNSIGTLVALYLVTVGVTGLQLLGAANWVAELFNGIALVAAVTLARLAGGKRS